MGRQPPRGLDFKLGLGLGAGWDGDEWGPEASLTLALGF